MTLFLAILAILVFALVFLLGADISPPGEAERSQPDDHAK